MCDISIIVPAYNAEKYIEKCLDSLLNQTKKEIEIILINDGSTDNTDNIIKKYDDSRIVYIKNQNQGIGKTRNVGIERAKGKYIMFVDSDDYLEYNACELLYNEAEKKALDLVVCDFFCVKDEKTYVTKIPTFDITTLEETPDLLVDVNSAPWNKLYLADLIKDKIKFVENLKYEDAPFVVEALKNAKQIGKLNMPLNYYVIHENSETTILNNKVFDIIKIVQIIRETMKEKLDCQNAVDHLTVKILTNYTIQQRIQKDRKVANQFIKEVFSYLKNEVPYYKTNNYYQGRSCFQRLIEKSYLLTIIYVNIYYALNK